MTARRLTNPSGRVLGPDIRAEDKVQSTTAVLWLELLAEIPNPNHMSFRNDNELVLQRNAFERTKDVSGLIVHSDQGFQYTSYAYYDMLPQVGAQISISRRGNCYDNASMESFFSHL
ncbi:DDE-type integrase/transposase/recombinase [Paenibacillus lutimineralis]|uniref:Integrase catalytic domain-containing protein n=1 Tax=Paenibacillus lutimineralis TaxID=2707005 RepID=A0A3S9UVH2_9BACL|nr:DDE-type integrase/transposase/recombinase [Paenibacillus lutimineralis]AZS14310.1 hypothetical protein EI981_07450 [Paenibacillus lutimineralis]